MTYRMAFAGLLLFCVLGQTSCPGGMCTAMGCGNSMEIVISHGDGGDLDGGEYVVEVDIDGVGSETLTCVPGGTSECDGTPGLGLVFGYMEASAIYVSYAVSDGEEPPDSVQVAVTFGGEPLGSLSVQPSWSAGYPNGEDCEPACWTADDEQMEIERPI
jgi:hypothetical protein